MPDHLQRSELLILDTGLIRELVLFHAVDRYGFEGLRRDLRFFMDRETRDKCGRFISLFRKKITTASAVAELNYWIRETEELGRERLWTRVCDEFKEMNLVEEVVPLGRMDVTLVMNYGPVDASLITLARHHELDKPVLLTIDGLLCGQCAKLNIRSKHIHDVLAL